MNGLVWGNELRGRCAAQFWTWMEKERCAGSEESMQLALGERQVLNLRTEGDG